MKLYTYQNGDGIDRLGVGYADRPGVLWPLEAFGLCCTDMNAFIRTVTPAELDMLRTPPETEPLVLGTLTARAPIPYPAQDVLCLGINYRAHHEEIIRYDEQAFGERPRAIYFSKRGGEANCDGGVIPLYEGLVDSLDYEAELGVILGKDAKNVKKEDAAGYIFGYTIVNDVSARNLQTGHKQWYFGKSLDGFTPLGPCIVTADEIAFPPVLPIRCTVNGELRQDAATDLLITSIPEIIAELTQGMTLKAGTIIATGTPSGVGMGMEPPCFLKDGDVVVCEIGGIGTLTNVVKK